MIVKIDSVLCCVQKCAKRPIGTPFGDSELEDAHKAFSVAVVQTLSVVDNSVFSPISLTVHSDSPSDQKALSFSHFKPRGPV